MTNHILAFAVIGFLFGYASSQCSDSMSDKNTRTVTYPDGKGSSKSKTYTSCFDLFQDFPGQCTNKSVSGKKGVCCETCSDVNPKCMDQLSTKLTHTITFLGDGTKQTITQCEEIIPDIDLRGVCKTLKKKLCCESCKAVNIKCVNQLTRFGKDFMPCSKYIEEDPCRCADKKTKKTCCESCKLASFDKKSCSCRDLVTAALPAQITISDAAGKPIVDKAVTNCEEIVNYYVQFCNRKKLGGKNNFCCKSCTGKNHKCSDNLLYKANAVKGSKKCMNCDCHQIMKKGADLMAQVCNDDLKAIDSTLTAKKACCLQCSRV